MGRYRQAVQSLTLDSLAIGRQMEILVVIPPDYDPSRTAGYPALYFLHPWGLSPSYIINKLELPRHLWAGVRNGILPPMVIALPTGHRSFYLNAADPPDYDWTMVTEGNDRFYEGALEQYGQYGDYLLNEVIPHVERHYHVREDAAGRAIGGISMGAVGAAIHAFRNPSEFCALGLHSPALFAGPPEQNGPPWIFGVTDEDFAIRDPVHVARTLPADITLRIWLDTGSRDMMRNQVERLHCVLLERGIAHEYSAPAGGHDKTYWEPRMSQYLTFYARGWQ